MSFARFELSQTDIPWRDYSVSDESVAVILRSGGPTEIMRRQVRNHPRRRWRWSMPNRTNVSLSTDQRHLIDAFLVTARLFSITPFLLHDPKDCRQTAVSVGTGDNVTTVFALPTSRSSAYFPHYPFDSSSVLTGITAATVVKVDGGAVSATVQTDARTVTLASAASTLGKAITVDYDFYRLCLFVGDSMDWSHPFSGHANTMPEFEEIIRDN